MEKSFAGEMASTASIMDPITFEVHCPHTQAIDIFDTHASGTGTFSTVLH